MLFHRFTIPLQQRKITKRTMLKLNFLKLCICLICTSSTLAAERQISTVEKRKHNGHSENPTAPPTVTYDDDNGTVKITTDSTQVGSTVTVTNESGETELQASTYSTNSVFPLSPLDGETLTISIATTSGNTYEGAIN